MFVPSFMVVSKSARFSHLFPGLTVLSYKYRYEISSHSINCHMYLRDPIFSSQRQSQTS